MDIDLGGVTTIFVLQVAYDLDKPGIPNGALNMDGGAILIGRMYRAPNACLVGRVRIEGKCRSQKSAAVTICISGNISTVGLSDVS